MKNWIQAARLRTLPLALSCTFMGSAIALQTDSFRVEVFVFAVLTTILLQVLSNFANDYGDFKNGADTVQARSDRMLSSGKISEASMKKVLIAFSTLSLISGLILLIISFGIDQLPKLLGMLLLGLGAIWAALKYTAGDNPYGYRGLGDLFVFLFFGLVGVLGTVYLYQQSFDLQFVPQALVVGFLSVAVLNLNNMRDIINDEKAGKNTIPVRLGFSKAKVYHSLLLFGAWILTLLSIISVFSVYKLLVIIPLLIQVKHLLDVFKCTDSRLLDPELKKVALSTFLISFILFLVESIKV